uniref:adhesion G protein-coupled receptor G3-like isoform X2 n=1 Tax=Scatophagus argus TaxID=75038 RepID=UPI001ED80001|nr:adhesion G protein-coupled receptor G3-like isoform X2 [Scatophagus argus]
MNWKIWGLFVGLLWISPGESKCPKKDEHDILKGCLKQKSTAFLVPDKFNEVITHSCQENGCILFLRINRTEQQLEKWWPQIEMEKLLQLSKWHISKELKLCVLQGIQCDATICNITDSVCHSKIGSCSVTCFLTKKICKQSTYNDHVCNNMGLQVKDKYIINMTGENKVCINCDDPVKTPGYELNHSDLAHFNVTVDFEGGEVNPSKAAEVMSKMSDLAASINVSSAVLTLGEGVTGLLVRETEPEDVNEVSFAYMSANSSMNIIENKDFLDSFTRSVTVPKEAFEKSISLNISVPFAAVFRFLNMAKDERNSSVLGNEVLAVEMGATISNLTDQISINFRNMKYEGIPSCQSWNGEGKQPNWTNDGCLTKSNGENITCQCSHLTFFAILLTPLNQTISSSDLNNLTIITQVGCGLSMFFLSIVFFMHFLMRKTKASKATGILIQLVCAMFLLNFTFLINNFVAKLESSTGCKIMAAVMHYFLLATFNWFSVQAFHICLQLYKGGKVVIHHYLLKVSITSWALPGIAGISLLAIGKYGKQVISTSDTEETVTMCWITDSTVHYIVNIGYYTLVFLFTFTTFIIILSWLFCLKRTNTSNTQISTSGKGIVTILGLCCMLGITWGFAFFSHGTFQTPAYYIFTVLNSFQGFFLFIYYYNVKGQNGHKNFTTTTSSTTTIDTNLDSCNNPYINLPGKK